MAPRTQAKNTPTVLTAASVRAALKASEAGERWDKFDGLMRGLELRVSPRACRWSIRARSGTRNLRVDLGAVAQVDDETGHAVGVETARKRAQAAKECLRRGGDLAALLRSWTGLPEPEAPEVQAAPSPLDAWTWEIARERYLDDVKRTRRLATYDDYRGVLHLGDMKPFAARRVSDIRRQDIARVVAAIHTRGAEAQAEHALRVLRAMWTWLGDDSRSDETGVSAGLLARMRPPERTRRERGDAMQRDDDDDDDVDVPNEIALGRALAVARSGAMPKRHGLLIQLLLASGQRRRTVVSAHMQDFRTIDGDELWSIPPANRKTARKRRSQRNHVVPLVGWGADAARRLWAMASDENGWIVPAAPRGRRAGAKPRSPHADAGLITGLLASTGAGLSPHGVRRAMATYGERDLGWARGEAKVILDHLEGAEPGDVTREFYALDPGLRRKREMIAAWVGWLDKWCDKAISADPALTDVEAISEIIYREKYGDEKWKAKLARVRKRGGGRVFENIAAAT
jgi:hypothetical protein